MKKTTQEKEWSSNFGEEYTDRNYFTLEEMDKIYLDRYGITRTEINKEFLKKINKKSRILEVGCNVGNQLLLLKDMGYLDLWGVDISKYAVKIAKKRIENANIIESSALNIPFKDKYFDLVFTSGLLIHVSPKDIDSVLEEIYRCSKNYIWGLEYFSKEGYEKIQYREHENLLWKTDFLKLFIDKFSDLKLINERILQYKDQEKKDIIYLLKKEK